MGVLENSIFSNANKLHVRLVARCLSKQPKRRGCRRVIYFATALFYRRREDAIRLICAKSWKSVSFRENCVDN